MKKRNIGKKIVALLLAIVIALPMPALNTLAAVGDLSNVSTGLNGDIDTTDTISLPIKIYDYEADGMLFEYAESKDVLDASNFGSEHYVVMDATSDVGNAWYDVTVSTVSNDYITYTKNVWAGNTSGNWVGGNAGIYVTPDMSSVTDLDDIRYVTLVYRSNVSSDSIYFGINRTTSVGSSAGDTGNYTGAMTFKNTGDDGKGSQTNWTYAVYDLKTGSLSTYWNYKITTAASGLYIGLPIDASGEYIELAHIAMFSDKTMATKFGEYALTDGSDRGDNRAFGLLRSSRTQSNGTNYNGIIDETDTVEQLYTYGDTSTVDYSTLTTLGYTLLGTFKDQGIANVGLLQSGLSEKGYPLYKEEVVTYLANLLKHSLEITERTSDGWKNYRYVKGTESSIYGGTDLATALRTKINGTTGSYAEASAKDLVGTWSEVSGNIASYYDAAYFLLNSIFVSGSYNEEQDDYDYLVLSAGTDSETGLKTYVFDAGFSTSTTPSEAESAVKFDETNNTISNTCAIGKAHFVYESADTTTLNPFLPVTDKNNASGQTQTVYSQDDGVLNTELTKDTYVNRNFNYVMVSEGEFVYHADDELFFDFEGDDDVYLFINGELVMDIGSAHSIDGVKFYLNDYVEKAQAGELGSAERNKKLSLEEGNTYSFKFYYMERHGYGANIRINTNIHVTDPSMTTAKTAYQDDQQIDYGSIIDKDKVVEYGFAITNSGQENLYNLTFKDNDIGVTLDPTNGLIVTGERVYDVNGGTLEATDLVAVVSHPDYDDITITFASNETLKAFLASLTNDAVIENGGGLWIGSTVLIRGIGYKLSEAQVKAGVFDNTVFTTSTNKTESKTLQGQATMRVFVPADPMYYEWAGHDLVVSKEKFVTDVLAAAAQEGNILADKVPNLTKDNVNKIETCTSSGNAISYDAITIDSNYNLTINYEKTGSYVFYVKITYNTDQTVKVPVLVNVLDVEDSVYVLDYGLSVELTENNELFKNDTLTVPGRSTDYDLLGITTSTPSYSPNNISFNAESDNVAEGADGTYTLKDSKTLTYMPTNFMEAVDSVWLALSVHETDYTSSEIGNVNINEEAQMYKCVSTLPATVVYYEDNFPAIHYTTSSVNTFTQVSNNSNLTQSADQTQNYGQDAAYADSANTDESGKSLTTITINSSGQVAYFDFAGTGFELISRTNAYDSAKITVKVYPVTYAEDGTVTLGTVVKNIPVITEFDNGADGGTEEIYQVPVIRVDDLTYGNYRVIISGVVARDYDNLDGDGKPTIIPTKLYVDGLRIFQPIGAANENYLSTENGATFAEIRNLIVEGKAAVAKYDGEKTTISTGTITWTENRNGETYDGTAYEGNKVSSVDDYLTLGPNNEVYMNGTYETAALVFYVEETEGAEVHNLQIAVHGVDVGLFFGTNSTGIEAAIRYGIQSGDTYAWMPLVTTVSATEQYYTIDYTKCPYVEGRGYQVAIQVDEGMASYTSLKYNGLTLGTMNSNEGEVTNLYYDNGVLTTKTDEGTAVTLEVSDYPAVYSIRTQLLAQTVSSGEDMGLEDDGNVEDGDNMENDGNVEGDDNTEDDGNAEDGGNSEDDGTVEGDDNTEGDGTVEDDDNNEDDGNIEDSDSTEDNDNEDDTTNNNGGSNGILDVIKNVVNWFVGIIKKWFTK